MRAEMLIYIYGAICLSMIGFNLLYNLAMKRREPRLEKQCEKMKSEVMRQLDAIRKSGAVQPDHLHNLQRRLQKLKNLMAFDRVMQPLCEGARDDAVTQYLAQIRPAMLYLADCYRRRDATQAAYFAFLLSRYIIKKQMPIDSIQDVLLGYIQKQNLYCSVNALQALCAFGDARHVLAALKLLDASPVFMHEKILTESLLSYAGDHDDLIRLLWMDIDAHSEQMQLAILNYIRFKTDGYQQEMFAVMQDEGKDKELRLSAIRYLGRYTYEPALDALIAFASDRDLSNWEYATVSLSSLVRYPGDRVMDTLKAALHSSNWYIRQSAALSLEARGVDYSSMMDVIAGNDRYAREMVTYRLETQRLQKAGGRR